MEERQHVSEEGHYVPTYEWAPVNLFVFRVSFVFFSLFSIPLDWGFYKFLFLIDYPNLTYRELTEIVAFYNPQFLNHFSESGFFGIHSYGNIPFIF